MLEMLLENQAQCKAEQKLERESMPAEWEQMAAERYPWAAEGAERSIRGQRQDIYKIVNLYGTAAVRNSWTDIWTRYVRISTPTASYSHPVHPITSNTRSLTWTPGAITKIEHSGKRQ